MREMACSGLQLQKDHSGSSVEKVEARGLFGRNLTSMGDGCKARSQAFLRELNQIIQDHAWHGARLTHGLFSLDMAVASSTVWHLPRAPFSSLGVSFYVYVSANNDWRQGSGSFWGAPGPMQEVQPGSLVCPRRAWQRTGVKTCPP